ncbi:MAG: hypothetical protein EXQ60_03945 [Candidatus Nanopelagicales bacterium]|nr:hypothetical protein [Candidatus Nanopelagicales bacterium]
MRYLTATKSLRLVSAFLISIAALVGNAPISQALPADSEIEIVLDQFTPVVPKAKGILRISGRVLNISGRPMESVFVQLRVADSPLTDRSALTLVNDADLISDVDDGSSSIDATRTLIAPVLAPNQQEVFTISIALADLGLTDAGTYLIAVEALGAIPGVDEFEDRKGIQRTFLPWFPPGPGVAPTSITWLWPLVDWPARNASGVLLNDETPMSMSPGGRLDSLVRIGADSPGRVSWFADPDLLQAASTMSQGYLVQQHGNSVVGDQSDEVSTWLASVRSALDESAAFSGVESQLRVLPYADIDATAVHRTDLATGLIRAVTQAPIISRASIGAPVAGITYWAPGGRIDDLTAELLVSSGVTSVVLSTRAVNTASNSSATATISTPSGALTALLIDPLLANLLTTPKSSADDVILARQQFLAETALLATSTNGLAHVIAAPLDARWSPDPNLMSDLLTATATAPWLSARSLDELLASPPVLAQGLNYGQIAKKNELPTAYLQQVMKAQARLQQFVAILDDPAAISVGFSQAITRTLSAAWRSQPLTGKDLLKQINTELAKQMDQVHTLSTGTITFSGDAGRVPITLANDLDQSVTVSMQLVGVPAARLESPAVTNIVIEAGHKVSVEVEARVIGGDPLPVNIEILTPEGEKYGVPSSITLTSTAYSRAAGWVVGAAFLAILIFVVFGVTRRIWKAQRSQRAGKPSDTVSS